jgi:hypothetical protein
LAAGSLIRHGFEMGREGSHGAENNVSKATKNFSYIIDIIILL